MTRKLRRVFPILAASFLSLGGLSFGIVGASSASGQGNSNDDWSMFGHDPTHSGISPDFTITAANAPNLSMVWSRQIGTTASPILASPAVTYNATLGETLVYEVTSAGRVAALDASDGAVVWQTQLPKGVAGSKPGQADVSSPAVYDNTLYLGSTGALEALNATTGVIECSFPVPIQNFAQEAIIDSSPVVGNVDGTGPTVFFGNVGLVKSPHNVGDFWAVTGVGNTAGSCKLKWTAANFDKGSWDEPGLVQNGSGQWVVIFGSDNTDDGVYAVNAVTGARLWRFQTAYTGTQYYQDDEDVGDGPTISAPGVNGFAHGALYINSKDGIEYALSLTTGKMIWSVNMNTYLGGTFFGNEVSEAALVGDTVYVAFASHVFAFNAKTGAVTWVSALDAGDMWASPTVTGPAGQEVLFVGTYGGYECALNLSNGKELLKLKMKAKVYSSTSVSHGMAFFASATGSVYALGFKGP